MSDQGIQVRGCTSIEQLNELTSSSLKNSDIAFFYNPPTDYQIYHITCKLLSNNDNSLSDHTFYYQLDNDKFYQITCRLISHSLIVQFLNKNIHGIELRQNEPQQEYLTFSNAQRENLELHLKEFLFNYLAPKQINNPNSNVLVDDIVDDVDNKIIPKLPQPKL